MNEMESDMPTIIKGIEKNRGKRIVRIILKV
jgi:hypothetical protein